jgi:hypothetical protein
MFAIVMAVPALGYWRFHLNGVVAFWWAYIATRPLGASIADWLSKPTKTGGLDQGDGPAAAGLLMTALVVVTYVAVRNRSDGNETSSGTAQIGGVDPNTPVHQVHANTPWRKAVRSHWNPDRCGTLSP